MAGAQGTDAQRQAKRNDQQKQLKAGREDYAANKDSIRNDRKNAAEEPPADTSVTYLPPGYEEVTLGGTDYMKLGATYYRPYYEGDAVTYVVSKV